MGQPVQGRGGWLAAHSTREANAAMAPMRQLLVGLLLCGFSDASRPASALLRARAHHAHGAARKAAGAVPLRQPENPLISLYRQWTSQYEKDALVAERDAKMYSQMAVDSANSQAEETRTKELTKQELKRINAGTWAHATWQVEQMLHDPAGAEGAKAGAAAAEPFNKAYAEYTKSKNSFDAAAQAYGLRVGMDSDLSKKLATYSDQYRLQGNKVMADEYETEAKLLMKQAETFKSTAEGYNEMSTKIYNALPVIQSMAGTAANFAAWQKNPGNHFGPEHVFPFTVMPPISLVQVDAAK